MTSAHPTFSRRRQICCLIAVLVMLQGLFIIYSRRHDYFFLDDFLGFILALDSGLNASYLAHDVFGPFSPGFRFFIYVYIHCIGLHYSGVRLFEIATIASASVLLCRLAYLWRAPGVLLAVVFAFLPFSPIFSGTFQWLSTAASVLTGMVFALAALVCLCPPRPIGWRRRCFAAMAFMVGLLFHAKLLFLPVLLGFIRLFVNRHGNVRTRQALMTSLRDIFPLATVAALYLAISMIGHYTSGKPPLGVAPVMKFIRIGFTDGFAASLFGLDTSLPWRRAAACVLVVLPVFVSIIRNPSAALIWLGFSGHFVLGMIAVAWARVTLFGPESAALSRYHTETAVFYMACVLMALGGPRWWSWALAPGNRMTWRHCACYVVALLIALALASASLRAPLLYAPDKGEVAEYVTHFRESVESATCKRLVNDVVPDWIMPAWMQPWNRAAAFATLFPARACFTNDKADALIIDANGRLKPALP